MRFLESGSVVTRLIKLCLMFRPLNKLSPRASNVVVVLFLNRPFLLCVRTDESTRRNYNMIDYTNYTFKSFNSKSIIYFYTTLTVMSWFWRLTPTWNWNWPKIRFCMWPQIQYVTHIRTVGHAYKDSQK